jgi:glucokinase
MSGLAISVDLGGTQVRAALVDRAGTIVKRVAAATQATAGPEAVVAQILTLIDQVRAGVADEQICGVGVSSPGPLDTVQGLALSLPTLSGFESFALKAAIQAGVAWPVQLENDGIAAAIGEWQFGAGRGLSDLVYVTVSTGIGGGVISGNRVVRGRRGMAGHVGHMIIVPDGALCNCGVRGCFEAYGAGPAFAARGQLRASAAGVLTFAGEAISGASIFKAARDGDALALDLVAEEAGILGRGFASLAHLFSPEMIIMGGGVAQGFELLEAGLTACLQKNLMPAFRDLKVVKAALADNSGLLGAAHLVFAAG